MTYTCAQISLPTENNGLFIKCQFYLQRVEKMNNKTCNLNFVVCNILDGKINCGCDNTTDNIQRVFTGSSWIQYNESL